MVRMVVDRLHVSSTPLQVCRALYFALAPASRADPSLREARRDAYREAVMVHQQNQDVYMMTVTGRFSAASRNA